jgi:hypothetical protein
MERNSTEQRAAYRVRMRHILYTLHKFACRLVFPPWQHLYMYNLMKQI